jgi:glutamyl-tRNA synthetase
MDWGNAIVRSKVIGSDGQVTSIEMDLHLDGDFRKTKKKVTWLPQPTTATPLADVTLLDYDYLITKKKLEETDELKDFVPPVTEFRTEAYADANVIDLVKGDIIQFERKGYFSFDGVVGHGAGKRLEFIHIPDGKQASLASKAPAPDQVVPLKEESAATQELDTLVETSMYEVDRIYGKGTQQFESGDIKMYSVSNLYHQ